ncbi:MAG: hypothetical protein RR475_12740, partial [Clostridia bacterium]
NATEYVCHWDATFAAYLANKRAEGKHYNVAISHAAKKLVRLIYALEKSREPYRLSAYFICVSRYGALFSFCFAIPFCNPSDFCPTSSI